MKYRTKGNNDMEKNIGVKIFISTFLVIPKPSDMAPKAIAQITDKMSIQTAYIGYLSFKSFPSEFTKMASLFKDTFCFFEIIYGVTKRLTKDISGISNMLDSTKPVTNMSQNIRFQKLSFDRNLFVMVFGVFLIVNNSIVPYQQGLSKGF